MRTKSRDQMRTRHYLGSGVGILAAMLSISLLVVIGCATVDASNKDSKLADDPVYVACMNIEAELAKAKYPTQEKAVVYADTVCRLEAAVCRDNPSSDPCRQAVARYVTAPGADGPAILYQSAWAGRTELVRYILELKVDPNASGAANGWCPLMIAAAEGHETTVEVLLEGGAYCNARNELGRTPLMFASSYGYDAIVRNLLAHGADPNIAPTDGQGWTALMAAGHNNRIQTIRILLDSGADASLTDKYGTTAQGIAAAAGHREAARLLQQSADSG